jgi:hypothetical protein
VKWTWMFLSRVSRRPMARTRRQRAIVFGVVGAPPPQNSNGVQGKWDHHGSAASTVERSTGASAPSKFPATPGRRLHNASARATV